MLPFFCTTNELFSFHADFNLLHKKYPKHTQVETEKMSWAGSLNPSAATAICVPTLQVAYMINTSGDSW